jgi:hypothetical protein
MTLSDFATFSTAISGLAVTASLIYLALQTHQNSKHTKALIQQGRADRTVSLMQGMATADIATAMIIGDGGDPTPEEVRRRQFQYNLVALFVSWEDTFGQHEEGLLSEDQFGSFKAGLAAFIVQPGFRRFWKLWKERRPNHGLKFQAFVDSIIPSSSADSETS